MPQLDYSLDNPIAVEGALYDGAMVRDKISALAELVAGIRVAKAVKKGTDDDQVILPTAAIDITEGRILGVSILDLTLETPVGGVPLYSTGDSIPLMRKGRLWVIAEDDCVKDAPVYVRFQNGDDVADFDGGFSGVNTADHDLLPAAKWFTSASAGELAVLEINFP